MLTQRGGQSTPHRTGKTLQPFAVLNKIAEFPPGTLEEGATGFAGQ
jgi:hypothetical protein